ncbi:MAG: hypothetical protein ACTSUR_08350 [Candidatus Heimdallarchaeaceae archaeon]
MKNSTKDISETRNDLKVSWQLFKANYKSFIATEIFALVAFILINLLIFGVIVIVFVLSPNLSLSDLLIRRAHEPRAAARVWIIFPVISYLLMSGFLYCQFGLSYDIFSSGDMFTAFSKSFTYFKKHWWKYILLTFVTGFSFFVPDSALRLENERTRFLSSDTLIILFEVLRYVVFFIVLTIFSSTLPSVTSQGKLKNSFIESFRILKKDWKRLFKTWSWYFLIFIFPAFLMTITLSIVFVFQPSTYWIKVIRILIIILTFYKIFIGFPMFSLIATRIYNTVKFERFNPLPGEEIQPIEDEGDLKNLQKDEG